MTNEAVRVRSSDRADRAGADEWAECEQTLVGLGLVERRVAGGLRIWEDQRFRVSLKNRKDGYGVAGWIAELAGGTVSTTSWVEPLWLEETLLR